jgi:hypothetical protein
MPPRVPDADLLKGRWQMTTGVGEEGPTTFLRTHWGLETAILLWGENALR